MAKEHHAKLGAAMTRAAHEATKANIHSLPFWVCWLCMGLPFWVGCRCWASNAVRTYRAHTLTAKATVQRLSAGEWRMTYRTAEATISTAKPKCTTASMRVSIRLPGPGRLLGSCR